jgi:hypothetical protein
VKETAVSAVVTSVLLIFGLTLLLWAGFYVVTPATPLSLRETAIVADMCAAIVWGFQCVKRVSPPLTSGRKLG